MGLMGTIWQRLPLSPAMVYLPMGFALGPSGLSLVALDPYRHASLLTLLAEIALLVSLFTVGLKLRVPLSDRMWRLPLRLGIVGGFLSGWLMARATVGLALYLRQRYHQALGMEEFLTIGLIAVSYGVAHLIHGVGFIAVFAAGVATRRIEHKASGPAQPAEVIGAVPAGDEPAVATDPGKAPAYMAETVLEFNQQLDHIAEFVMVLLLGIMLSEAGPSPEGAVLAGVILLVIRPVAVMVSLLGARVGRAQRWLIAWFGIRGIGSLYYLAFVLRYEWPMADKERLVSIVLTTVTISVLLHGISATPLMDHYHRQARRTASHGKG